MIGGRATEVPLPRRPRGRTLGSVPRRPILRPWARRAGALLFATAVYASSTSLALADETGIQVSRRGGCSGPSHWTLTVRRGSGDTLLVRLVVAGGRADQRWHVLMDHNGERFFSGSSIAGTGGSFAIRRRVRNLAGIDTIRMGAYNPPPTEETCRGRARI